MSNEDEENKAAPVDSLDNFVNEVLDQDSGQENKDSTPAESAPAKEEKDTNEPALSGDEKPKEDGFQKRIDKVTADKYAEKRRADDLQKRIDDLEKANSKDTLKKPKIDDPEIDYDEDALEKANRDYEISQGVNDALEIKSAEAKADQQKAEAEKVQSTFNDRISALGKSDFAEKANAIPNLPAGIADAIMQSEDGAQMVYHLGSNPEEANSLANMSPSMAAMELGKLSTRLSAKPEIKPSAAPEPIDPLKSGSSLSSDIGDEMSMNEWMKKYG